jgi:hypothetical protein
MSENLDLTLLSGTVTQISRDIRLMQLQLQLQLQLDSMAARLSGHDGSFDAIEGHLGVIEGRLGALEGSFHDLLGETARGFGQQQQQLMRLEKRIETVGAGLDALGVDLAESTTRILQAIAAGLTL